MYQTITTVITAASSYDLTTLAVVKAELSITDASQDVYLARQISVGSASAAAYCNRVFQAETVLDEVWPQRDPCGYLIRGGVEPLQLSRWPIVSVATVVENGVTLAYTDYRHDDDNGQLIRLGANGYPKRWPAMPIATTYTGGFAAIPADVEEAVLRMIKMRWFSRLRDPLIKTESIPGVHERLEYNSFGVTGNLTPDIADLLDGYRVPIAL